MRSGVRFPACPIFFPRQTPGSLAALSASFSYTSSALLCIIPSSLGACCWATQMCRGLALHGQAPARRLLQPKQTNNWTTSTWKDQCTCSPDLHQTQQRRQCTGKGVARKFARKLVLTPSTLCHGRAEQQRHDTGAGSPGGGQTVVQVPGSGVCDGVGYPCAVFQPRLCRCAQAVRLASGGGRRHGRVPLGRRAPCTGCPVRHQVTAVDPPPGLRHFWLHGGGPDQGWLGACGGAV